MKTRFSLIAIFHLLSSICVSTFAQGTAFTYQGRLNEGGNPANGSYDLRFKLFEDSFGNTQAGSTLLTNGVPVTNGLFMVTINFGAGLFTGSNYWLEVDVRTNGTGGYTVLNPLQSVTPAPYAIFAESVGGGGLAAGTYGSAVTFDNASNQFNGAFTGNGASISNVNAATFGGLTAPNFWQLGGNNVTGGQFLGSTNNQPVEIWAGGQRAMRFETTTNNLPNVLGGISSVALPGASGATIGGGTNNVIGSNVTLSVIGGGGANTVLSSWATIAGGYANTVGGINDFIGGGWTNTIALGNYAVIAGGVGNFIGPDGAGGGGNQSVIAGGYFNTNNEFASFIGGGSLNTIQGLADHSVIAGGGNNTIAGSYAQSVYGVIGGGYQNTMKTNTSYAVIGGGSYSSIGTNSFDSTIAGGSHNSIGDNASGGTVGGGLYNTASGSYASVAGGTNNMASGFAATIGGGTVNTANYYYTAVGGGYGNTASGSYSTVPGGYGNSALNGYSFAAGYQAQALYLGSFVWADASGGTFSSTAANQFSVRASGGIRLAGDVQLDSSAYHYLSLTGGNSLGFLYGSFLKYADGIHLGYNYYADASGLNHIINSGGGTSRISVGYNSIVLATGDVGVQPNYQNVVISGTTTTVNGTFNNNSDRNAKQEFLAVSSSHILEKVAHLPVSEWSYKSDPAIRHVGPMAQDFYAAFNIGTDDKHIAPIDEGGVALAAIKGLNEKVESGKRKAESQIEELKVENAELKHANAALEKRLEALEQIILNQNPK